ncbi:hypothetical protein GOP47_0031112 [Adiantum capillus-veneris]|nr:hypothetical protein GOP47_0031112 [Adiantum capillus-veneris]
MASHGAPIDLNNVQMEETDMVYPFVSAMDMQIDEGVDLEGVAAMLGMQDSLVTPFFNTSGVELHDCIPNPRVETQTSPFHVLPAIACTTNPMLHCLT